MSSYCGFIEEIGYWCCSCFVVIKSLLIVINWIIPEMMPIRNVPSEIKVTGLGDNFQYSQPG